ncbi:hypothetical protein [Chryseobacterium sp. CT-SW4]|uniref:hypothetical protein n=1 Tax=Chryseobacterium sp. SW-1 TaxID=3157343 RepID=UPI003B011D33
MKKNLISFMMILLSFLAYSQVGIGIAQPNAKSMLDVTSTTKGLLVPRMTTAQRDQILANGTSTVANPTVNGLLIYNTDVDCFNYWSEKKSLWVSMGCDATPVTPVQSTFATYTVDCSKFPAADTNTYTVGSSVASNSVVVPVNVTQVGSYFITITSDNGITYSTSGTFTSTGVQNVTVANGSGAPSSTTINFSVAANGTKVCSYVKPAVATGGTGTTGSATYTSCNVSVYGDYTVATALTTSNYIVVSLNVTSAGPIRLLSEDKNGILFDSGTINITSTGTQNITLKSVTATSGRFPLTSEEVSQGANGGSNQTASYSITNTLTNSLLGCSAVIDVKPKVWQTFVNTGNDGASTGPLYTGANNGMIDLEMQNNSTFQPLGIGLYYKVWARNISGTSFNYSIFTRSSADPASAYLSYTGSLGNNSRVGSLDVYLQPGDRQPVTTGEIGAHAGPKALFASENSETGMNITLGNVTDSSKWFNNLGAKKYKYRLIFNSKDYRDSGTNLAVVLYGIYDSNASVANFDPGDLTVRGGNPQDTYWP